MDSIPPQVWWIAGIIATGVLSAGVVYGTIRTKVNRLERVDEAWKTRAAGVLFEGGRQADRGGHPRPVETTSPLSFGGSFGAREFRRTAEYCPLSNEKVRVKSTEP